jgi:hypothetical protein
MAVKLTRGDGDGDMCVLRLHPACTFMTDWWWGDGCISVCAACGGRDDVTDASMRKWLKDDGRGWGPVPKGNTDRVYPQPRVVGKMSKPRRHPVDKTLPDVVSVTCPNCGFVHMVTHEGWIAIGCPCGTDLARNKRSL